MSVLERYWPAADRVNACIKNEAETADASVLLAVHQPSSMSVRNANDQAETPANEAQLLAAFLSDDVPSGFLFLPIEGPSGAGKSHMIRWLDAQLRRSPKSEKLHIIRIPKSASLRKVVELILEPLASDPRYAKQREEVSRAVEEVNTKEAVVLFRAQMENALNRKRQALRDELQAHPERTHIRPLLGHAMVLPRLFSDAALEEHFGSTVLERIIAHAVEGRSDGDEAPPQFEAHDLLVPDAVDLHKAAEQVRNYYLTQIASGDGTQRKAATDLLNSLVDEAIGNVFRLQQATGGMSLQDIILAVRETLLEDGMELVLLVEDFAALAGIQDVLLKVCIQEGVHDGHRVRATMRTAMALTDGYLVSRDTVLSRAQRVWAVGRRPLSAAQVKSAVVGMAGAYLNAARWGEDSLTKKYKNIGDNQALTNWLDVWEDGARTDGDIDTLNAFGFSAAGHPLFPFNREALERLAERHLKAGGDLVLNPRRVINEILRATLLMRQTYLAGAFPPAEFHRIQSNGFLASWVGQLALAEPTKRRLDSALAVWGGDPATEADLSAVSPTVLTTFCLPSLTDVANVSYQAPERNEDASPPDGPDIDGDATDPGSSAVGEQPTSPASEDPKVATWRAKLDEWSTGVSLTQPDARDIRNALGPLLRSAMNWSLLRIPSREVKPASIFIANARGNPPPGRRVLTVCADARDADGSLRAGFLGALRYSWMGQRWDYPDGDTDYIAVTGIIDRLRAQLTPILLEDVRLETAGLGQALITQGRIGGLAPPLGATGADGLLRGLFAPIEEKPVGDAHHAWRDLQQQALGLAGSRDARKWMQELLLERVGSFQGGGDAVLAIDLSRLSEALAADSVAGQAFENLPDEVKAWLGPLAPARVWNRIQPILDQLRDFHAKVDGLLGGDFNKLALVEDLKEVVNLMMSTGIAPALSFPFNGLPARITEFQLSPVSTLVKASSDIVADTGKDQLPKILNLLGGLDHNQIAKTAKFLADVDELLTRAAPLVAHETKNREQANPVTIAHDIGTLLARAAGRAEHVEAAE
jgi:hypothetical protein